METKELLDRFAIEGTVTKIIPFGNGHINKTYKVTTSTGQHYLFQCVNGYVFHDIDDLMRNILIVSNHLKYSKHETLEIVKTKNNKLFYKDGDLYYRVYKYLEKTISYEKLDKPELISKVAQAFGQLHNELSTLDSCLIAETIKDFHNTPKRINNLLDAVKEDPLRRVYEVKDLISFVFEYREVADTIMDALENAEIPERIVHNDPKINNVLFDEDTNEVRCVIDLDTIMPGSCLFDVGDALRSIFTGDNESSRDTSLLKVDFKKYDLYIAAYLNEMKDALTKKEIELIPSSIATIALELGVRFLEDYIRGDKYFAIHFPDENLVRARGQFALAKNVIENTPKLKEITERYLK